MEATAPAIATTFLRLSVSPWLTALIDAVARRRAALPPERPSHLAHGRRFALDRLMSRNATVKSAPDPLLTVLFAPASVPEPA